MDYDFFITPSGKIKKVTGHIEAVIAEPELFGYTREGIEGVFEKYDEQIGSEGSARDELLIDAFKRGWIRGSYHPKYDKYVLNGWSAAFNNSQLQNFAMDATLGEVVPKKTPYADVVLQFFKDNSGYVTSIKELMGGVLAGDLSSLRKIAKYKNRRIW
jgi:hypothetical protein